MIRILIESNDKAELEEFLLKHNYIFRETGVVEVVKSKGQEKQRVEVEFANRGGGRKKKNPQINLAMIQLMHDRGDTMAQIAEYYGVSRATLYKRMEELKEQD